MNTVLIERLQIRIFFFEYTYETEIGIENWRSHRNISYVMVEKQRLFQGAQKPSFYGKHNKNKSAYSL